jgi:hypothetical protein
MSRHYRLIQLIADPSTNELSASRLAFVVLMIDVQIMLVMEYLHHPFPEWAKFAIIVGSVCGIYGINSGVRVWRGRVIKDEKKQ